MLSDLIKLIDNNTISSKQAKEVLYEALTENKVPTSIVEEKGLKQIGTEDEILKIVQEVLEEIPESVEQYKNGRTNIVDFLVGQVMKKTRGQANPAMARSMMISEIEKR
jgi:aspartyl-tRNA(Asn)/glutamyl-tRNA(Gln) amidotransferase subunit B